MQTNQRWSLPLLPEGTVGDGLITSEVPFMNHRTMSMPEAILLALAVGSFFSFAPVTQAQDAPLARAPHEASAERLFFVAIWQASGQRVAGVVGSGEAFTVTLGDEAVTVAFRPEPGVGEEPLSVAIYEVAGEGAAKSEGYLSRVSPALGSREGTVILGIPLEVEIFEFTPEQLPLVERCCVTCGTTTACGRCVFHDCGVCCEGPPAV